jgi:glutamate 5-kinase
MRSKLAAAAIAQAFGCATLIARGHDAHPISRLAEGAPATLIAARGSPAGAYKQWIAASLAPAGALAIDGGAVAALSAGKSLLPAGARKVEGRFHRGACLSICDPEGREIARGITSYASDEIKAILGCGSDRIEEKLGFRGPDELIHRNDLVLL